MLYVTSDFHGDFTRFQNPQLKKLKRNDHLIICGDFGFIWDNSKQETQLLNKLSKLKYTILFIDGVHENFKLIEQYPLQDWNGGIVRVIRPNILYLPRGQVYTIDGKTVFALGGGDDVFLDMSENESDEIESMPTLDELEKAYERLKAIDFKVDYIITHDCSSKIKNFLDLNAHDGSVHINYLNTFLEALYEKADFKHWYFGAYHLDKLIPPKCTAVYKEILPLDK